MTTKTIKPETHAALPRCATLEVERDGALSIWRISIERDESEGWKAGYRELAVSRNAFADDEKCFRAGIAAAKRHGYTLRSGAGNFWNLERTDLFERWVGRS